MLAFLALLLGASRARADDAPLDGPWSVTALTETFVVQQWGGNCGPAPKSRVASPAGPATVTRDGGELVIAETSPQRVLRTDQCIDPLPTLARDAHSADGHTFRTHCATPSSDPRHAVMNAAYFLTGDGTISIGETGRYEFTIKGSRCVADVTRQATAKRASPAPATVAAGTPASAPTASAALAAGATSSPSPASAPADDAPCSAPGDPARLEVRPSRKLLRLGDSYRFRAIVVDGNGCPTGTPIQWSIAPAKSAATRDMALPQVTPAIDGSGKLTVPESAIADAKFEVVASAAGHSARAAVEVTSPESYEALLAQSGLDSNGERREPSVTSLATSSLGANDAQAVDGARRRRLVFIAIVGGLALLLGVIAVLAALRARKARAVESAAQARHAERMRAYEIEKRDREERHAAQTRAHLESLARAQQATVVHPSSGPLFCPSCHREFPAGTAYCPFDSNRLVAVAGHEAIAAGPAGGICPTCRRGFNPGVRVCPQDGDELVPPAVMAPRATPVRGKICPTCGGRFDGNAAFCGKDGTQLVLIN